MARSIQAKAQCFEARFMTLRARFDAPLNAGIMCHPISRGPGSRKQHRLFRQVPYRAELSPRPRHVCR